MSKKRVGLIGYGYWGPNQLNSFYFHPEVDVVRICDTRKERLEANKEIYKNIDTTENYKAITQVDDIDAVVICTPTSTHHMIAKDALLHGKDVLCEKPLTIDVAESEELVSLAKEKNSILMLGHVFLYNPGILKLKEYIQNGECGDIYYYYSQRTNLGPVRNDVNVVYDLASHDLYIFNYLLDGIPKVKSATGQCLLRPDIEDIAFIVLEYPNNKLVHLHVSWLDPKKTRYITVVGDKKMATWNDMMARPIELFSKHIEKEQYADTFGQYHLVAKEGEVLIPHVKNAQPLKMQTEHFVKCIKDRTKPLSDGENGLQVVRTLKEIDDVLLKQRLVKNVVNK